MEAVKRAQKELYVDLNSIEAEVQSLLDQITQVKALGHSAEEQEKKVEILIERLNELRQRI